jgi:SAM-dependent methyltransferase
MHCTEKILNCLICQGLLEDCLEKFGFLYTRCRACGFIFVNPRPDPEELTAWYAGHSSFRAHDSGASFGYWEKGHKHRPERFVLSRLGTRGKVLDIGCGYGENIALFQSYKERFECFGIEPDAVVAEECAKRTGVKPYVGIFEQFETAQRFDLIVLNQVIEHVLDPRAWLLRINELLAPGGVVVFGTPIADGYYSRFLGRERDPFFHAPLHLNHFTAATLSSLIAQCGMTTVLVHRFSDLRPISFYRHLRQPRWTAKLFWQLHRPVAAALDLCGLGILMYVAAKKSPTSTSASSKG